MGPIVLWSDQYSGNLYLQKKNTFLEFYTDENKAIKRCALPRSASVDSHFKHADQSTQSTATPTRRSESPSDRSMLSSDNDAHQHQQCGTFPGSTTSTQSSSTWDADCDGTVTLGHPTSFVSWLPPTHVNESEQEMQPQMVKPRNSQGHAVMHAKPCKKQDLKKFNKCAVNKDIATTLMIRGIPCNFSQEALITLIDDAGMRGKYNFFYLPRDGNKNSNLGYSFINFVDQPSADLCQKKFSGIPLAPARSMKICTVSPADIQGLPALWKHFRRTAVSRGSHGPMFLKV